MKSRLGEDSRSSHRMSATEGGHGEKELPVGVSGAGDNIEEGVEVGHEWRPTREDG